MFIDSQATRGDIIIMASFDNLTWRELPFQGVNRLSSFREAEGREDS